MIRRAAAAAALAVLAAGAAAGFIALGEWGRMFTVSFTIRW